MNASANVGNATLVMLVPSEDSNMDKERAARAPDIDDFLPSVSLDALFPEFSMSLVFLPAVTIERAVSRMGS